jgi:hypothetical protein
MAFKVLVGCLKPLPHVITASSAKVGSSHGNTWGVTPTEGTPGVDLALETKASAVPPRRINPEQVDDASALAESLQDVALVPETTVQPVPDATMTLLVDQKVPTNSHLTSF